MPVKGIVELAAATVRFGEGAVRDVGMDAAAWGLRRVLVFADPNLVDRYPVQAVRESLKREGIAHDVFDQIVCEPTDASFQEAIAAAQTQPYDGFIAVGGGSTIDTAKAANLYATHPAEFPRYVARPHGDGEPPPGPLRPLIAIPTTTGTGSETTTVAVFDFTELGTKAVIGHRHLKPVLALLDPLVTKSLPEAVVASTGLDVVSHAIESLTAAPYTERELPDRPADRPAYQGSNPVADVWALEALRLARKYLRRAAGDPEDLEARGRMLLAASFAGLGFGSAGVHLPHAMSYPVSSQAKSWQPPGYPVDHPLVPHGFSVILTTPAAVRFLSPACPRSLKAAAAALGADAGRIREGEEGEILAERVIELMEALGAPGGLRTIGYHLRDIPALVAGALPQKRILGLCPRPVDEESLSRLFEDSMVIY